MKTAMLTAFISIATLHTVYAKTDVYHVQPGDTLWGISQKYEVDLSFVIKANPQLKNPDLIYPKEKVYVPYNEHRVGKIGASIADSGDGLIRIDSAVRAGGKVGITSKAHAHPYEMEIVNQVNQERVKYGLPTLNMNARLSNMARIKSEDMRDSKYFDHNSPKYGGPFDMMKAFGISYKTAGENIANGQHTPSQVMDAWMTSSGHRKNILNPIYTEIGVGFVTDNMGATYWTQHFISR